MLTNYVDIISNYVEMNTNNVFLTEVFCELCESMINSAYVSTFNQLSFCQGKTNSTKQLLA